VSRCIFLLLACLIAPLALGVATSGCGKKEAVQGQYYCPMHPTYISDRPGDCPICNMRLVPIPAAGAVQKDAASTAQGPGQYVCPMHPMVVSATPTRCSICGMDLEFVPTESGVTGMAPVELTREQIELAGVATITVTSAPFGGEIRTSGIVVADESRVRTLNAKVSGYVERLLVATTGEVVRAGQPILAIYSPELLAAQEEYLNARASLQTLRESNLPEARESAERLLAAARRRLELLDVPTAALERLETSEQAERTVTFYAPGSGFITTKDVVQGARIEPGMPLYTVTDLSSVWVEAAFYEQDARRLQVGETARITLPFDPTASLPAKIVFIAPTVDLATRALMARFELDNRGLLLKPGMYADVVVSAQQGDALVIPADAILDTGVRRIVFIQRGETRFEPREITLGRRRGGDVEVLAGLQAGDRIVIRANFLLDSESRIRAAMSAPATPATQESPAKPATTAAPAHSGH